MSLPQLSSFLTSIWAVAFAVLLLGGSIFIHELGHYLAARRRGVLVTRFSIGFGPKIFSWHRDGVEWRLSWIPLGGYVALPQLADMRAIEGESAVDLSKLPPLTYPTRVIVFVAGVVFNLIFATFLACVLWFTGVPGSRALETTRVGDVLPTLTVQDASGAAIQVPSPAAEAGLRPGDIITAIDGQRVNNWQELQQTLFASTGRAEDNQPQARLSIERDGVPIELVVRPRLSGDERVRMVGITSADDFIVETVTGLAATAGFQPADRLVALGGVPLHGGQTYVQAFRQSPASPVVATVERAGARLDLTVPDRSGLEQPWMFGLEFESPFTLVHTPPHELMLGTLESTSRVLWGLIHPSSDLNLSHLRSPVGIAQGFYRTARADYRLALWFAVLVNVNLAVLNLLPIPVLDGGHILIATINRLRRRPLPPEFMMKLQGACMVLLLGLMLYVLFFDVRRIGRESRAERPPTTEPATP